MKKMLLLSCMLSATMLSCTEPNVTKKSTGLIIQAGYGELKVVTLDSCEYLLGAWGNATVLTHKGNCKHCKLKN